MMHHLLALVLCLCSVRGSQGDLNVEGTAIPSNNNTKVNGVFFQSWISKNITNSSNSYFKSASVYDSLVSNSNGWQLQ